MVTPPSGPGRSDGPDRPGGSGPARDRATSSTGGRADVADLRRNWEDLGRRDPLWAVLADPRRHGNRWDEEEFFATGEQEVAGYLAQTAIGGPGSARDRALDFGCGAGRLTQALATAYHRVDGVDLSSSMLAVADTHNRYPGRVRYHHNDSADLGLFPDCTFDLVLSVVVLQHMPNKLKAGYVAEFLRVLRPGGVAVFTVPSHARATPAGLVHALLPNRLLNVYRRRRYGYEGVMELHPMRRRQVEAAVVSAGGVVVEMSPEPMAGPRWHSYLYVVRPGGSPGITG